MIDQVLETTTAGASVPPWLDAVILKGKNRTSVVRSGEVWAHA